MTNNLTGENVQDARYKEGQEETEESPADTRRTNKRFFFTFHNGNCQENKKNSEETGDTNLKKIGTILRASEITGKHFQNFEFKRWVVGESSLLFRDLQML